MGVSGLLPGTGTPTLTPKGASQVPSLPPEKLLLAQRSETGRCLEQLTSLLI